MSSSKLLSVLQHGSHALYIYICISHDSISKVIQHLISRLQSGDVRKQKHLL